MHKKQKQDKRGKVNVAKEQLRLKGMTVPELRQEYAVAYCEETQSTSKQFLIKRILWRMQCNAEGDISELARKRALEIANDADLRLNPKTKRTSASQNNASKSPAENQICSFVHDARVPQTGSRISRKYKGDTIWVTVEKDGFAYNGRKFNSLSAIATEVTGCHQNGFRFFKLNGGAA